MKRRRKEFEIVEDFQPGRKKATNMKTKEATQYFYSRKSEPGTLYAHLTIPHKQRLHDNS